MEECLRIITDIGIQIRKRLTESLNLQSNEYKSAVHQYSHDDVIYQIDKDVEDLILLGLKDDAEKAGGVVLVAEGLTNMVFPIGITPESARYQVIIDPIDGTRGLMYNKRSAFYLAGIAPNKGQHTRLSDIEAAVMVELPTAKSYLADTFSAIKGKGVKGWRTNLFDNSEEMLMINPSRAKTIYGGFAQFSRFFSPGKDIIATIEEKMIQNLFPSAPEGVAFLFEDQYISTGGQFYELLMGHDRFTADIRAALYAQFRKDGSRTGLSCHPYDLCASLILTEAGIPVLDMYGQPIDGGFNTTDQLNWIAYANQHIQNEVEPILLKLLSEYRLM